MPVRLLSEKDVRFLVPTLPEVVALVEQAYRLDGEGKAEVPTKIGVHPGRANSLLHAMPAWVGESRALGMKWVSYFPGNADRGLPDLAGIIVLNDPEHGQPCCIMEAMLVTFLRTAACAAVAAKHLAPREPRTLGLIGCGGLGRWSLRGMTADGDWQITPVDDPLLAVRNIDIVVTSIPPCFSPGADCRPVAAAAFTAGTLLIPLDLMHSWQDDVLACADRIAADNPAHFSAGPDQA